MGDFKATLPRANPPVCWLCDKRLYSGGRMYVMREVDGVMRPCHGHCVSEEIGDFDNDACPDLTGK